MVECLSGGSVRRRRKRVESFAGMRVQQMDQSRWRLRGHRLKSVLLAARDWVS
jgi:hypothetical protein